MTVLDEPAELAPCQGVVVYAARTPLHAEHLAVLRLASWGRDECIEYLLEKHHRPTFHGPCVGRSNQVGAGHFPRGVQKDLHTSVSFHGSLGRTKGVIGEVVVKE